MVSIIRSRNLVFAAFCWSLFATLAVHAQDTVSVAADPDPTSIAEIDAAPSRADARVLDGIEVTAKGTAADLPAALATSVVTWQDAIGAPIDFQDLIVRVPGIGATGQNGLFETFSIRGSGGNGILVLVGGTPITPQRRAGVPVAFVQPSLLGEINVTRGPATVHFGPGALGGAISIEPRWFDGGHAATTHVDSGSESSITGGFGNDSFSIGAARHRASDSQSANDTPLNTSFERDSASLQYRASFGDFGLDALLLPSKTEDIGKSNSRFPARDTTYPEDEHLVARLRLAHTDGFEASVHGHEQSLLTYNQRPGTPDTFAFVESTDIGGTVQQTVESGAFSHNFGIEVLGRRDVNGFDARGTLADRVFSLRDAREDGWSLFAISDWKVRPAFALELGARYGVVEQEQSGADSRESDTALTAGAVWSPGEVGRWSLNVASGYRFATLEERFFSGVTPQGEIVGNPELSPESSFGIDLGYAWQIGSVSAQVHAWRTRADDLIQLFAIAPGVNGYTNVGEARLHGADGSLEWRPTERLSLVAGATLVRSKNELTGDPLYGSPPVTATLEAKYDIGEMTFGGFYSHRWRMRRPGFEEVERDAVDVLDLDLTWRPSPAWDLRLFVRNAFNEDYFATADALSALAQERAVGLSVSWDAL
jgi:iron complex outermembrane receptor protein